MIQKHIYNLSLPSSLDPSFAMCPPRKIFWPSLLLDRVEKDAQQHQGLSDVVSIANSRDQKYSS